RGLHFSYVRYLENRLRETFGFVGTPLRLSVQKKQKGDEAPTETARVRRVMDVGEGLKPSRKPTRGPRKTSRAAKASREGGKVRR
ncbi:MAG: hypothetical protein LWX11_05350, partial [Firmicutes bacterium]|nr:hypothetical protein [Bacillota bacterium]